MGDGYFGRWIYDIWFSWDMVLFGLGSIERWFFGRWFYSLENGSTYWDIFWEIIFLVIVKLFQWKMFLYMVLWEIVQWYTVLWFYCSMVLLSPVEYSRI